MTLPQTVSEFNAISDKDSRLAIEIALQLRPINEVLQTYDISRTELAAKLRSSHFQSMVKQAKSVWGSDLSAKERIRLKAQVLVEDSILEVFKVIHNSENAIPAKLDAFKQLARVAEVDQPDKSKNEAGSRFTVSINLGEAAKNVVIEGESTSA